MQYFSSYRSERERDNGQYTFINFKSQFFFMKFWRTGKSYMTFAEYFASWQSHATWVWNQTLFFFYFTWMSPSFTLCVVFTQCSNNLWISSGRSSTAGSVILDRVG